MHGPVPQHASAWTRGPRPALAIAVAGGVLVGLGAWWTLHATRSPPAPSQPPRPDNPEPVDPRQRELLELLDGRPDVAARASALRRRHHWGPEVEHAVVGMLSGGYHQDVPFPRPRVSNPAAALEPEKDWQLSYQPTLHDAIKRCRADPEVIAFDQAVVVVLALLFPDAGSFDARPGTPPWKTEVRDQVRGDLLRHLGPTEAEARAALVAQTVGRPALDRGADLGQAVRAMGEYAFPTASWSGGQPWQPWQRLFAERAAAELQAD